MTKQEIFNKVLRHFRDQASPCVYEREIPSSFINIDHLPSLEPQARYRHDGKKDVLGFLLTDEEYSPKMEKLHINVMLYSNKLPDRLTEHINLIKKLIYIHDEILMNYGMEVVESRMKLVAQEEGLTHPSDNIFY